MQISIIDYVACLFSSQSFGHNPTVNDVINFLVRENGVTSDIRLDLICDKKVLMYDLLLEDIYEHVWLCSDVNNVNNLILIDNNIM